MRQRILLPIGLLWLVLVTGSMRSSGYAVTQIAATYQNGQVFLTWTNPTGTNLQYNVYRSTTPITSASQITSGIYLGFVRDNSGKNMRKSDLLGQAYYFVITPGQAPLASNKGLYVVTCSSNSVYYYAVTVTDLSTNAEAKTITVGGNSLQTGVSETVAIPQPVLQTITTQITGDLSYEYVLWGNNQNLSHWKAFNNVGSYGYNFTFQTRGNTSNQPLYVQFQDGNPFSPLGSGLCSDCNMLQLDDRLPNGMNTYWIGYNDSYNMYVNNMNNPIVTTGTIHTYTQAITQAIIRWTKRQSGIDSTRIYMTGGSHNGFGCLLTAMNMPSEIACIYTTVAPILYKSVSGDSREHHLCASGSNLPTDIYYPGTTTPIPIWSFCKMATYYRINTGGIPFAQAIHGKNDTTVGWIQKFHWYDTLNAYRQGGTWYWDQRAHGSSGAQFTSSETTPNYSRYKSNLSYPAFAYCSINQNPGSGNVGNGAAYGAINGYLDWFDNSITDQPCSYSIKCYVKNFYVGGQLDPNQYDSCLTDITFRRTQQFHPGNGQTITWTNYGTNNNLMQSGTFTYNGGLITLTSVKIKKTGSTITLKIGTGQSITYYADADADTYGNNSVSVTACVAPSGYVTNNTDCNDANSAIRPNATEVCNGVDDNCSGQVDEGLLTTYYRDADGDGYGTATLSTQACSAPTGYVTNNTDCNDGNAAVRPGATEVCNGVDDNCSGVVDEGLLSTYYRDADSDGYGSAAVTTQACSAPSGFVTNNTDCNDNNAAIRPGATEVCNGLDDNCSGAIDEGVTTTYYRDADGDNFGALNNSTQACSAPTGYVTNHTDCNDNNSAIRPNATEVCNNVDDNCNGQVDEGVKLTFYIDADGDGYGNASVTTLACSAPSGYVSNNTDCNDANSAVRPGATEVCNGVDDNCTGGIDEGVKITFYLDADGDGYGNSTVTTQACTAPSGYVSNNTDCNDANSAIRPGAIEACNGVDDNCSGVIDEGVKITFYLDADGDGYGSVTNTTQSCSAPSGYVSSGDDCNDSNSGIHPGATEVCNGADDNCSGAIDEGVKITFYLDADGDGYGSFNNTTQACSAPSGYVSNSDDCNDSNSGIRPGATEFCNGVDDNCSGAIDEGVKITFYLDADGDGYGSFNNTTQSCSAPSGYVSNSDDCNDSNSGIRRGATEFCNDIDDNCSGQVDEGVKITFYLDGDGDGYGNANATTLACSAPSGYVVTGSDCNDGNGSIRPGAVEVCNTLDDNCDNQVDEGVQITFYLDSDGDGFGGSAATSLACSAPSGYVANNSDCNDAQISILPGGLELCNGVDDNCDGITDEGCAIDLDGDGYSGDDCNDFNPNVHPNATEVCNSVDDNCNSQIDEGALLTFYADADGDGYGNLNVTQQGCSPAAGFVADNEDCNDANLAVHPNATEVCNSADDNCNGQVDDGVLISFYLDADGDSYGNVAVSTQACSAPSGYVSTATDCNDGDATISPLATETCNTLDDNCNGQVDEGVTTTFFADSDNDGYGDMNVRQQACTATAGYVLNSNDCNDSNAAIYPLALEICNTLDDNCNGTVDEGVLLTYYSDSDGDNYGNAGITTQACATPSGYTANNSDCNDGNGNINPAASEVCNTIDDNCNNQTDEGVVSAAVTPAGAINICSGAVVTMQATASGSGLNYQWKKNSSNISGATSSTYTATKSGSYTVVVAEGTCAATSSATALTVMSNPAATVSPSTTVQVCTGSSATFTANSGSGLAYQWLRNSIAVSGATNLSYSTSTTGTYSVNVANTSGCSKTSSGTALQNVSVSVQLTYTGSLNICSTGSITLNAQVVSGYAYQWYKGSNPISGATATSYVATQAGSYKYLATTTQGCTKYSSKVTVAGCKEEQESIAPVTPLTVYPNPLSHTTNIFFSLPESENVSLRIYDVTGRLVRILANGFMNDGEHQIEWNASDESGGIYFLKMETDYSSETVQLSVLKQ